MKEMEEIDVCKVDNGIQDGGKDWRKKMALHIHAYMLPTKFTYLFWGGLIGTWQIFINAFFLSVGLTATQAGLITGLTFLSSSIAGPLWGMLTDYTGRRKAILLILSLVSAASIGCLPWVAKSFVYDSNLVACDKQENSTNSTADHNCAISQQATDDLFQVLLIIMIFGAVFINTLPNFMEAIKMDVVNASNRETSYGGQRIFGSIGTCVWVYVSGVLVDTYQFDRMSPFTVVFVIYVPCAVIMIPTGYYLIHQASSVEKKKALLCGKNSKAEGLINNLDVGIRKNLLMMFRQPDVIFFMLTVLVAGIAFNLNIYFGVLLVKEQIKDITQTEISVVFVTASVSSILMFPLTINIIRLLRGPFIPITFGVLSYCVRYLVMSYTTTYWVMVAIQVFHCIGFALLWSAMMEHVATISPKKIKVTMILILQTTHFGISPILLNMVGGSILKAYSSKTLFLWDGILCGLWSLFLVAYCCWKYYSDKTHFGKPSMAEDGSSTETFIETTTCADGNTVEIGDGYFGRLSTKPT